MASSSLGSPLKKAYSESTFESTRMQQGQPDEAARLRRGTIDDDLKAQMITRARDGRASACPSLPPLSTELTKRPQASVKATRHSAAA